LVHADQVAFMHVAQLLACCVVCAAGAASAQWRQGDGGRITSKQSSSAANDLALRSQSFTSGYQSPSQLFEVSQSYYTACCQQVVSAKFGSFTELQVRASR
jgi:hypothetical protein